MLKKMLTLMTLLVVNMTYANDIPKALQFKMKTIDGVEKDLADYKGKVVLFVNVASKCGYTPQYDGLEALNQKYKEKGLRILGFPSNDFLWQEPGTEKEIKTFCQTKYNVTFDMFSKIKVKGKNIDPLYKYLTETAGKVGWNFHKFLMDKSGNIKGYESKVKPQDLEKDIEKLL